MYMPGNAVEIKDLQVEVGVEKTGKGQQIIHYNWSDGGEAVDGPAGLKYLDRTTGKWSTPNAETRALYEIVRAKLGF